MALQPNIRLGPYSIVSPIGAGGMGVVYRAEDVRLGRHVALKFLPEEISRATPILAKAARPRRGVAFVVAATGGSRNNSKKGSANVPTPFRQAAGR